MSGWRYQINPFHQEEPFLSFSSASTFVFYCICTRQVSNCNDRNFPFWPDRLHQWISDSRHTRLALSDLTSNQHSCISKLFLSPALGIPLPLLLRLRLDKDSLTWPFQITERKFFWFPLDLNTNQNLQTHYSPPSNSRCLIRLQFMASRYLLLGIPGSLGDVQKRTTHCMAPRETSMWGSLIHSPEGLSFLEARHQMRSPSCHLHLKFFNNNQNKN